MFEDYIMLYSCQRMILVEVNFLHDQASVPLRYEQELERLREIHLRSG